MSDVVDRSLLDLVESIVDNRGRTCPTSTQGIPLIATNCLKDGKRDVVYENIRFVDEDTYANWFRGHPKPGDVLFVCKGSPGRVAVVPDPVPYCIAQDMVALRANSATDPGYLYYRLRSPDVQFGIQNMHVGTMIPHFKKGDFGRLTFPVHVSRDAQKAIAGVLSSLDNKIVMNERVLAGAESLMLALVSAIDVRVPVSELAKQATVAAIPTSFDSVVAHFSLPAFDNGCQPDVADRDSIKSNKFLLSKPCVLFSKLNPRIPRIWNVVEIPTRMAVASTEFVVLVPERVSASVLWAALAQPGVSEALRQMVAGTSGSHQRIRPSELLNLRVADIRTLDEPSAALVEQLGRVCHQRRLEARALASTRDELLPLLMSGKIRVKDAEARVSEVV